MAPSRNSPCIEGPDGTFHLGVAGIDLDLDEVIEVIQEYKGFRSMKSLKSCCNLLIKAERFHLKMPFAKTGKERLELNDALLDELKKKLNGVFYNKQNTTTYTYTRLHFAPWTLVLEFIKKR